MKKKKILLSLLILALLSICNPVTQASVIPDDENTEITL